MATPILPTGQSAKKRLARQRARQVFSQLQPANFAALTTAQRWEVVRKVCVFVLRQAFDELQGEE
jgi:hypothetical protein